MGNTYQIYLISDSTGETLDRIFLALKAQFKNFLYETNHFSFTRTENQISKILEVTEKLILLEFSDCLSNRKTVASLSQPQTIILTKRLESVNVFRASFFFGHGFSFRVT